MTIDRSKRPQIPDFYQIPSLSVIKDTLVNGIKTYRIVNHDINIVRLYFLIDGGQTLQNKTSVARACIQLLHEGTATMTAEEIAEKLDFLGAHYEYVSAKEYSSICVHFPRNAGKTILEIFADMLSHATFPQQRVELYQQNIKNQLAIDLQNNAYFGYCKLMESLFGYNHPYGHYSSLDNVDQFTREDIVEYYHQYIHAGNISVLAAGNVDETFIDELNQTIGQLPYMATNKPIITIPQLPPQKIYIEKEKSVQSSILIGKRTCTVSDPQFAAFSLLNTFLGGYFGSRLMTNIREKKGLTYGIYSALRPYRSCSTFYIKADVNKLQRQLVIDEIYKEMHLLQQQLVEEEELSVMKKYIYGDLLKIFDGVFEQLDGYLSLLLLNLPEDHFQKKLEIALSADKQMIMDAAKQLFTKDNFSEIVIG